MFKLAVLSKSTLKLIFNRLNIHFASIPKKSASLIIAREGGSKRGPFDYDIFFFKRVSTGTFSDVYAFPGGKLVEEDNVAEANGECEKFKYCALRETFEETGLYFAANQITQQQAYEIGEHFEWKVNDDTFGKLTKKIQGEFSNEKIKSLLRLITIPLIKTRFDCYFFLCSSNQFNTLNWSKFISSNGCKSCLYDTDTVNLNEAEGAAYEWMNPLECLKRSSLQQLELAPPQYMLLNIMSSFFKLNDFTNFLATAPPPSDEFFPDPFFFPYLLGMQNTHKINPSLAKQYPFTVLIGGDSKYHFKKIAEQEEDENLKNELLTKVSALKINENSRNRIYFTDPKKLFNAPFEVDINCGRHTPFTYLKSSSKIASLIEQYIK